MTGQSDVLREKADALRRQAYDEEVTRLEKEIAFRAKESLTRWKNDEQTKRSQAREQAARERETQIKTLLNREQELLRQFDEEERRKLEDVRRRRDEDERRKREEEERRKRKDEEEAERKKKIAATQLPKGITREEMAKMQESRQHLANAESMLNEGNFEGALAEVSMALGLVPVFPDAVGLQEKIRQAQRASKEEIEKVVAEPETPAEARPRKKINLRVYIVAALVIVAAIAAFVIYQNHKIFFPESTSVAVLPFSGESSDHTVSALAQGLPVEIIDRLQSSDHVKALGFSSGLSIQKFARDPVKAATLLRYSHIVTGTITHAGEGLSLTVTINDTNGTQEWSHTYQNIGTDKGLLPDQIATDLLTVLRPEVDHAKQFSTKEFASPSAFAQYLAGGVNLTVDNAAQNTLALEAFQNGLQADPNSALLNAGAARAAFRLAHDPAVQPQFLPLGDEYLAKALAADGTNPKVIAVRGYAAVLKRDFSAATKDIDEALRGMQGSATVLADRAHLLLETGKFDEGVSVLKDLVADDPRNPALLEALAVAEQLNGATRDAIGHFDASVQNGRDSLVMLTGPVADLIFYDPELLANWGPRVMSAMQQVISRNPSDLEVVYRSARLQQVMGNGLEWNSMLGNLKKSLAERIAKDSRDWNSSMLMARTLTRLGQYPEAERYARQAVAANPANPQVLYESAQMYAVQMFSLKSGQADSTKKSSALNAIRQAVGLEFKPAELANGDFYNFRGDAEFHKAIQVLSR